MDTSELHEIFPARTLEKAYDYFLQGRVELIAADDDGVAAHVFGTRRYDVEIYTEIDESFGSHCTCEAFRKWGPCKHVCATLLQLDASTAASRRRRPPAWGRVPEWKRRLDAMRAAPRDPWDGVHGAGVRLRFVLDPRACDAGVALRLQQQRRLKNGSWSKPRPLAAQSSSVRLLDPDIRELARRVWSADPRIRFYGGQPGGHVGLGLAEAPAILRDLARAGVLCRPGRGDEIRPVGLDDGPPWELVLVLENADAHDRLTARLERDGASLELGALGLVVPPDLMLHGDRLAPLEMHGADAWMRELLRDGHLDVPTKERAELIRAIVEGPGGPGLRIAGLKWQEAPAPKGELRLTFGAERQRVGCHIVFRYGAVAVDLSDPRTRVIDPETRSCFARRREDERRLLERFLSVGGRDDDGEVHGWLREPDAVAAAIELMDEGWTVLSEGAAWRTSSGLAWSVESGIDWFDLRGGLRFGDEHVALPAVLEAVRAGRRHVRLADGSLGLLPDTPPAELGLLESLGRVEGDAIRFTHGQGWLLDRLLSEREAEQVSADRRFAEVRARWAAGTRDPGARRERKGFGGSLRPYQRAALGWFEVLRELGLGGCLADDMGLGKTIMVLALLHARAGRRTGPRPSLVVAPRTLVGNWLSEAARFAPALRAVAYTGKERRHLRARLADHDLVVTTYGVLRRDAARLADEPFYYAVLDEAQAIKNPASQGAKAARLLRAEHRLALTGTPVENHLGDLWSIMEYLNPGLLGTTKTFRAWASGNGLPEEDRQRIARAVAPVLLRRTKEQVLTELPARTESTLLCRLEGDQARAYRELAAHYRGALLAQEGVPRAKLQVLEALLRLRQVACHPGLVDGDMHDAASAKLETLLPMLRELEESGHKALVFSQFTSLLALVRARLDGEGIAYAYLDGRTRKRQEKVDRFQADPELTCFLISLKAGGTGLNLTAANYVFLLDPWWNPAVERQAVDRVHRIGQSRPVTAYRLVASGTVEERILELQERKRALADAIVRADAGPLKRLTRDDLEHLLRPVS